MPRFHAVLEVKANERTTFHEFVIDLPAGCSGIDVVRSAEVYARGRGWSCVTVCTGVNGAVSPKTAADPARRESIPMRRSPNTIAHADRRVGRPPVAHPGNLVRAALDQTAQ